MEDEAKQKAYFRFGVISPLLTPEPERTLAQGLEQQSECVWQLPDGRHRRYALGTIEEWLYRYRNGGLDALVDHPRRDKGSFPGVPEEVQAEALRHWRAHPHVGTAAVYKVLKRSGLIGSNKPSRSTFYRWATVHRPPRSDAGGRERRAFEAAWSGKLWQADIMYGPMIARRQSNGRRRQSQTYLVAVVDDHSRLLCGGRFFFTQSMEAWLPVLRDACCARGVPEKLYCDNGQVFTSPQIRRIGATLGMRVLHAPVRDGAAKGKIERFFRTVRVAFLEPLQLEGMPRNIEALNRAFRAWTRTHYNGALHSALGCTPLQRWIEGSHRLRGIDPEEAEALFLFETERTVKKDGTFSLKTHRFEIGSELAGKRVLVRYEPIELRRVDVWYEASFRGHAPRLDLHGNDGRVRRGEQ